MFGELLEEPPNDAENWKAVFYPTGKRCLVVASKGRTRVYLSNGKLYKTISSLLPGGSHFSEGNNNKESCVLDCILNETEMIFHVIDMLCWRSHPFYDCETDFRFFWLNSKLLEVPVSQVSPHNPFIFRQVNSFEFDRTTLQGYLNNELKLDYVVDGTLIYHKQAHYHVGISPLCLWIPLSSLNQILKNDNLAS